MRMPLEGARPGVEHGERAELRGAEEARVGAELGEGLEGGVKQCAE